jgi:hypothetical protein
MSLPPKLHSLDRDVFYVARPDRSVHSQAESFRRQTARDFRQLPGLLVGVADAGG